YSDLGMQKILPDTSFLHQWRDKIEALVITHGHEDHIGAMPWVGAGSAFWVTYVSTFFDGRHSGHVVSGCRTVVKGRGPTLSHGEALNKQVELVYPEWQVEPVRVTHSIPDCCGLILRSEEGTIVHSGDWKIDETPLDGVQFDRNTFDLLGEDRQQMYQRLCYDSQSYSVSFASRMKAAADTVQHVDHYAIFIFLQALRNAQNLVLRCGLGDFFREFWNIWVSNGGCSMDLFNAKYIMVHTGHNSLRYVGGYDVIHYHSTMCRLPPGVKAAADASGRKICFVGPSLNHYMEAAYQIGAAPFDPQDELKELLRYVKPQHFLPVHGEYAFLTEHARLAHEEAGVDYCNVIKNGQMLGVYERPSRRHVSAVLLQVVWKALLDRHVCERRHVQKFDELHPSTCTESGERCPSKCMQLGEVSPPKSLADSSGGM
ncbi:beta-lactamase-like protein, partial [Dunaliella salina]